MMKSEEKKDGANKRIRSENEMETLYILIAILYCTRKKVIG